MIHLQVRYDTSLAIEPYRSILLICCYSRHNGAYNFTELRRMSFLDKKSIWRLKLYLTDAHGVAVCLVIVIALSIHVGERWPLHLYPSFFSCHWKIVFLLHCQWGNLERYGEKWLSPTYETPTYEKNMKHRINRKRCCMTGHTAHHPNWYQRSMIWMLYCTTDTICSSWNECRRG